MRATLAVRRSAMRVAVCLWAFAVVVAVVGLPGRADAATPVKAAQLHLDRSSGMHTVGVESFAGCSGSSAPSLTDHVTVSISADASGNSVITIVVSRGTFSGPVVELGDGRLELTVHNSGTSIWTLDGSGTTFSGTGVTRTPTCTVSAPESLTLDGAGLTLVGQPAPTTTAPSPTFEATTTTLAPPAPVAAPSPATTSLAASPTSAPARPRTTTKSSSSVGLIVGAVVVVAVALGGGSIMMRRRGRVG